MRRRNGISLGLVLYAVDASSPITRRSARAWPFSSNTLTLNRSMNPGRCTVERVFDLVTVSSTGRFGSVALRFIGSAANERDTFSPGRCRSKPNPEPGRMRSSLSPSAATSS